METRHIYAARLREVAKLIDLDAATGRTKAEPILSATAMLERSDLQWHQVCELVKAFQSVAYLRDQLYGTNVTGYRETAIALRGLARAISN